MDDRAMRDGKDIAKAMQVVMQNKLLYWLIMAMQQEKKYMI